MIASKGPCFKPLGPAPQFLFPFSSTPFAVKFIMCMRADCPKCSELNWSTTFSVIALLTSLCREGLLVGLWETHTCYHGQGPQRSEMHVWAATGD